MMAQEAAGRRKRVVATQIGVFLLERRLITDEQLEQALVRQRTTGELLGQTLLTMGLASPQDIEEGIVAALTIQYSFPRLPIDCFEIDDEVLALVPRQVAWRDCLMPVNRVGSSMAVVMANPLDTTVIRRLEASTNCDVQPLVSTPSEIRRAIDTHYR